MYYSMPNHPIVAMVASNASLLLMVLPSCFQVGHNVEPYGGLLFSNVFAQMVALLNFSTG
jgi:hypothetical protein